ncbi:MULTISPECIES: hypothetical protein [unclassified Streptomyces]|uniref:hypothetical protein n=1 Tax=unclassified Streptomyces TaxID=2593676 RepID=UPI000DBACE0D|nr:MULTISPECIES: hypothetical protein [unclassified Streptomyces]MYT73295.1 hypothetical protein [Streptomyces sp. SID8367]RAJ74895.1 hypothetical protein K377_06662 [Streptomyces sp. PsTaAH-137]
MKTPSSPPQPPTDKSPTDEISPVPPPALIGRIFGIVVVLLTLGGMYWTFTTSVLSSGYVGSHGDLSISQCKVTYGSSKRSTERAPVSVTCHGAFRSSDGSVVDKSAQIHLSFGGANVESDAAEKVTTEKAEKLAVNRSADGTLAITSAESAVNYLCGGFFFMLFFAYGSKCALTGSFPKKGIGPSASEADQLLPKSLRATWEWVFVIGGLGLVLAVLFRIGMAVFGLATLPFQ